MYEIFGWAPALEVADSTSDHKGDEVSVEAIAQSNPDWLFVLDRDAAISGEKIQFLLRMLLLTHLLFKNNCCF